MKPTAEESTSTPDTTATSSMPGMTPCGSDVSMESMESISTSSSSSDTGDETNLDGFTVFPRIWHVTNSTEEQSEKRFTVSTYNILTDNMIRDGDYPYCPRNQLSMDVRYPRIMAEMEEMNADIVCLQEVDAETFRCRLQSDMENNGYGGVFHLKYQHTDDKQSIATFYKRNKFRLVDQKHCILHNLADSCIQMASCSDTMKHRIREKICRPVVTVMVKLQHLTTGQLVSVCNVHITWEDLRHPALQALQVSMAARELVQFAGGPKQPHILCGDFNTPVEYPAYHMLTEGCMGETARESFEKYGYNALPGNEIPGRELIDLLPVCTFESRSQLKSVYKTVMGEEPEMSSSVSYTPDENGRCEMCVDYFWYSNQSLEGTGVLATPPRDAIFRHIALPSILFPSDHLPLKAEFAFKETSMK